MRDPFEGVIQPGQSGWYWHEGRVIEVVRHEDGTLWVFWRVEGKDPRLDFPTGPRCVEPEEDKARRDLNTKLQGLLQQSEYDKNIAELRVRLRTTAQVLIEAVGAEGPCDAEDAAARAVEHLEKMTEARDALAAKARRWQEEYDHLKGLWNEAATVARKNCPTALGEDYLIHGVPRLASLLKDAQIENERLQGKLDAEKAYYACLQGEFNRAVALAQEHCPKPELGQSWLMAGIPLLAQRAAALEAEVERLKAHTWKQERAAIVAWLRNDKRGMRTWAGCIERGEHWPTEGGEKP